MAVATKPKADVPVMDKVPEVPAVFERPVGVRYAQLHRRVDIYTRIFNRYCPKIPIRHMEGPVRRQLGWSDYPDIVSVNGKEQDVMVCDPDVIYVGELIDGLMWLGVGTVLAEGDMDRVRPKILKNFINSITKPAGVEESLDCTCDAVFERPGKTPVRFGEIILDLSVGQITNSPTGGAVKPIDPAAPPRDIFVPDYTAESWDPLIREDPQFGLHYIRKGDQLTMHMKGWPKPRSRERTVRFVFRKPSEGGSYVPTRTEGPPVIDLSRMRG